MTIGILVLQTRKSTLELGGSTDERWTNGEKQSRRFTEPGWSSRHPTRFENSGRFPTSLRWNCGASFPRVPDLFGMAEEPRVTSSELLDYLQRPILVLHPDGTAYSIRWRAGEMDAPGQVDESWRNRYEVHGPFGAGLDRAHLWFCSEDIDSPLLPDPVDPPSDELTSAAQEAFDIFVKWQGETEQL
jgi:hypothetical protein